MSDGPRFESIRLDYGCHHGTYRFPEKREPVTIVGANGSGKSTLVEALVRTLFGFNRREPEAREQQDHRRPWKGGSFRALLTLRDAADRITIERDFDTHQVVVGRLPKAEELYGGEANPAAPASADQRRYREVLQRIFGLDELADYVRTACVQQGHMLETALAPDLLAIVAGGHADVETAKSELRERYHEFTLESIGRGERRRRKKGRIEQLDEELEELQGRIARVRRGEAEQRPLQEGAAEAVARIDELRREARRLEADHAALSGFQVLEERAKGIRDRIQRLEEVGADLRQAVERTEAVSRHGAVDRHRYPEDYLERLAGLEEGLWPRLRAAQAARAAQAERPGAAPASPARARALLALAGVIGLVAALLLVLGQGAVRLAGIAVALAAVALLVVGRRGLDVQRRRTEAAAAAVAADSEIQTIEARIAAKLEGLPDPHRILPETLAERRREHAEWRSAGDRVTEATRRLEDSTRRADRELGAREDEVPGTGPIERRDDAVSLEAARALIDELGLALSRERNERLAPTILELKQATVAIGDLPENVPEALREVGERLGENRRELEAAEEELRELQRRLLAVRRPEESSVALLAERGVREVELEAARREAGVYRRAHALLEDAYQEFRATDQDRLVARIEAHLSTLGDGDMGPLVIPDDLGSACLMYRGRPLALASPPLSYGELHIALFAVRLGAADFLAGMGVNLPLLVDDPFVHLDAERAAEMWRVLCRIARDRQVLLTTQDRLVLAHLGVRPDLDLDGPGRESSLQMELPVGRSAPG